MLDHGARNLFRWKRPYQTVAKAPRCGINSALVRLRESVHGRVKVPLWWCFPPRVESNCKPATGCGEQLETKRQSVELTGVIRPRHKLDTATDETASNE